MKKVAAKKPSRAPLNRKGAATEMQQAMDRAMRELVAKKKLDRPHGTHQRPEHAPKHHRG